MRSLPSIRADRKAVDAPILIPAVVLVVCFLIVAGIAVGDRISTEDDPGPRVAATGDTVKVDYVGSYANGWVFDTSLYEVAADERVPKSFEFQMKDEGQYEPMEFVIGEGRLLQKFETAVIGLAPGERTTVTIPAAEGYGEVPQDKLERHDKVHDVPLRQTMSLSQFEDHYGEEAKSGLVVSDPFYGWDVMVESFKPHVDEVMVKNLPVQGERYWAYGDRDQGSGWNLKVISVGSKTAALEHQLTPEMANSVKGVDKDGESFYLHEVDDGSVWFKYADERVGQDLTFSITLKQIVR